MVKRFAIIGDIMAELHDGEVTPGGAGATALALRDLGGEVTLRSVLGTDANGAAILAHLRRAKVRHALIDRDERPTGTVTRDDSGAIRERVAGVGIQRGAKMDIYELFGHDALILETMDQPLRRFISDLPAHTDGTVRMVSSLTHLDVHESTEDELEIALRFDAIAGTPSQLRALTGQEIASDALGDLFDMMPGAHLRAGVAVTQDGIEIVARDQRVIRPIRDAVPDLLLPQVVAAVAWGFANHVDWDTVATVAADPDTVFD